ncbi:MAG: hypothetical protein HY656_00170 [Acidobacteria bacterium]|nr:hypothetical protein [Acidobacteriota bacterium]
MKSGRLLIAALLLGLTGGPAAAQQPDYLTSEEVEKVRETQEPNLRVALFLQFATQRLLTLEQALAGTPQWADSAEVKDMLNSFIRAVDDAADALDTAMKHGGVDLRKARGPLAKSGADFLARLERIQKTEPGESETLRYDLEDALEATQDLLALGKEIPDAPIPPKAPTVAGKEGEKEPAPQPGKPTLKRREDEKPK